MLALCWSDRADAPQPRNMVLFNPCIDFSAGGMPGMQITELPWESMCKSTTCPVMLLSGNEDVIATQAQAMEIYDKLTNTEFKVAYQLQADTYGNPDLRADHMAPICNDGVITGVLLDLVGSTIGGDGEVDATDFRYYWTALDAALNDEMAAVFNMGAWSDGRAVRAVKQLAP